MVPVDYGYRDSKNFWYSKFKKPISMPIPKDKGVGLDSVKYAANRIDPEVKFTDEACQMLVKVPRVFLTMILKGCVSWAKENNVTLITEKEMQIINDKRSDKGSEKPATYNEQVDAILSYLNNNIQYPVSIGDLARHFYISESYICRIFKAATGTTINKYMTARRISIAKSLLAEGIGVSEVCDRCGFSDYSNFLKAFTKSVGISPKKYSQNCNR